MKPSRFISFVLAIAATTALAQTAPQNSTMAQRFGTRMQPPNAKSVTHNGQQALEFELKDGWGVYILMAPHQGEPSLGFAVAQGNCQGMVYVTRTRVTGEFPKTACQNFDLARESSSAERQFDKIVLISGSSKYELVPQMERDSQRQPLGGARGGMEFLPRTINNFDPAFRNVRRMAMEAQQKGPAQPITPAAAKSTTPATPAVASLTINTDPGDVQVYVNDEPRGMTSAEGREVLRLPAGTYRIRLSLPGYKDSEQQVTLTASKPQDLTAKLETLGPPPFKESDVTEMLQGKMSTKRIATLVQQRGVDFSLNPDLEKHLRALGATSDLLLVLAENNKKN